MVEAFLTHKSEKFLRKDLSRHEGTQWVDADPIGQSLWLRTNTTRSFGGPDSEGSVG
jgi:hypothetical protein